MKRIITETRATSSVDIARPAAPACTADDTANTINCGSLSPATLEVSTDGGTSWSGYSVSATYPGNQTVLVRTKASGSTPASMATSLTFTDNVVPVDHTEVVTLPTPTITATSITFTGGSVTDIDNQGGFTPSISYLVTDTSGKLVSASSLTPNTAYAWQMQYTTYDGATNTLTVKKTAKQNFTTPALADTTAPSQTSSLNLGTFTLGNSLTQTLNFDEAIASATISGLPTGVTATTSISGSSVTVTLSVNPTTFVFSSATQSIPFTLTVTDAANNPRANSETASVNDVAPNFAAQADATVNDDGGFNPIVPIPNICPAGSDQFGRSIVSCTVTVINPPH